MSTSSVSAPGDGQRPQERPRTTLSGDSTAQSPRGGGLLPTGGHNEDHELSDIACRSDPMTQQQPRRHPNSGQMSDITGGLIRRFRLKPLEKHHDRTVVLGAFRPHQRVHLDRAHGRRCVGHRPAVHLPVAGPDRLPPLLHAHVGLGVPTQHGGRPSHRRASRLPRPGDLRPRGSGRRYRRGLQPAGYSPPPCPSA